MKCLVVTALVVAAVGSSVPVGPHTVVHVPAAPLHYQASYPVGALPVAVPCADAAALMSAWNVAASKANTIETVLLKSFPSGRITVNVPTQLKATEEVEKATAQFMSAWNEAARRVPEVQNVLYTLQPTKQTAEVQKATREFMSAWEAAANQASTIKQAVTLSSDPNAPIPQQVEATDEVKKATKEFMKAWNDAASRVPTIETTMYQISGTVASPHATHTLGSAPHFTPSVKQATAEFMKAWNAAAAAAEAAPDVNIITGASHSQSGTVTPAVVTYGSAPAAPVHGVLQQVLPTPEVQKATAEFMAAWNLAAAKATQIQSSLVHPTSRGIFTVHVPEQVQATHEVQRSTAEFMEAWNKAAGQAVTVEAAVYSLPQPVQETDAVKQATAEFMAAWEAAAQQASTIRKAILVTADPYSAAPKQVEATEEVKKATREFMTAWNKAAARVPTIETTMYQISGTVASPHATHTLGSAPQFTPSVKQATAEFMRAWNAAAAAAAAAPDVNIITGASHQAGSAVHIVGPAAPSVVTYDAASVAPVQGVPQPVQPTPDVQRATAEFMAAWNAAAERATKIHAVVKSYDHDPSTGSPIEVTETDAVKQATREFMAAWNAAARRANVVVEYAVQAPQETPEVKKATSEFMTAWHAAAERASTIGQTVSLAQTAALPQQVDTTADVKAATAEFMSAWNEAAARVPTIETTLYTISGSQAIAAPGVLAPVSDTPEVKAAKESFMIKFRAAEDAALRTPITRGVLPVPNTVVTTLPIHHVPYSVGATQISYAPSDRIFAPFSGLPLYVKDCP